MSEDSITIRRCRHGDLDEVLGLWDSSRSGHASLADSREGLERLLADSPAALLVADAGGRIVGAVIAGWDGWRGNIYRLAVRASSRRQDLGEQLVAAAEEYLRDCGVERVTVLVAFDDDVAGSFWNAAGYPEDTEIGRRVRNI